LRVELFFDLGLPIVIAWVRILLKVNENIEQVIFQLTYEYGQIYLDRCGRILREILKDHPEWMLVDPPNPQKSSLLSSDNGCSFNFGMSSLDLSLRRDAEGNPITDELLSQFFTQIEIMSAIVTDRLEITEVTRLGFRIVCCFPVDSKLEADRWVRERNAFRIDPQLSALFEGEIKSESLIVEFEGKDRNFRLAIQAGERAESKDFGSRKSLVRPRVLSRAQRSHVYSNEKKKYQDEVIRIAKIDRRAEWNKANVAIVDVDSSQEEPDIEIPPDKFARTSSEMILKIVSEIHKGFA